MKQWIHWIIGSCYCRLWQMLWMVRDCVCPPKEEAVLFVTHPDDDTLFFHTFIKKYKPYVVLMTAGYSVNRLSCFMRNMKEYGVRFRAYTLGVDEYRIDKISRKARRVFRVGRFHLCATHNAHGEYGHNMHMCVHDGVKAVAPCPIVVPVDKEQLSDYPLPATEAEEKKSKFLRIYKSELFVLDVWPEWINNEHLVNEREEQYGKQSVGNK